MLGACVEHPVKLAIKLVGRIVSDALERKCPAPGYGGQPATDCAPASEVSLAAVVGCVASLVSRGRNGAAFTFGNYVVQVKLGFAYSPVAEKAGHSGYFSF